MIKDKDFDHDLIVEKLIALSAREFLHLGNDGLSYIRPVGFQNGKNTFTLCGADGSHIATGQDVETLHVIARQNNLIPMQIQ